MGTEIGARELPITFGMIKPEGVHLWNVLRAAITRTKFDIIDEEIITLSAREAEIFYAEHNGKPFFEGLIEAITSGPVIALALYPTGSPEIVGAVRSWRNFIGATNPNEAHHATLRGAYFRQNALPRNGVHGSDSDESALRELGFFFPRRKLLPYI